MDDIAARISAVISTAGAIRDPKSLFVLLGVTMLVVYGLSVGRTKALVSLLAIYVAYVLAVLFPYAPAIVQRTPAQYRDYMDVGIFLVLYGIVFMLISHSMRRTRLGLGKISLVQVLLLSFVQIGLLACIIVSLLPVGLTENLLGPLRPFIAGARALWVWAAASLLILPFMRARRSRE